MSWLKELVGYGLQAEDLSVPEVLMYESEVDVQHASLARSCNRVQRQT